MSRKQKEKSNEVKKEGLDPRVKSWIYTGTFIVAAFIFFIVNNSEELPEQGPYPPNYTPTNTSSLQAAPAFTLPTTEGDLLNLSDYSDKIVILDFWATWCAPCRKGIPDLVEIQNEYKDDVVIIGISVDTDTKGEVVPFINEYGINYPVVYGNMSVYEQYGGIRNVPTQFILNREGKIFKKYVGLIPKETYVNDISSLIDQS